MKAKLLLLMLAIGSLITFAQAGALDTSFDPGTGANSIIETTSIQANGKIIIAGWFSSYNETAINRIARLNDNGTLDNTFDPGTGVNNVIRTTSIQTDKIIIGGSFTSYNGDSSIKYLARLMDDGTLDTDFNMGGAGANNSVYTTYVQDDGKIIIGGNFTSYNGTTANRIARLNMDGTLDAGFNNGGTGADWYVRSIAVQDDGKIIIGGGFSSYNGTSRNYIARLMDDGTLDMSFSTGSAANDYVRTISIQANGKIIIGGSFLNYNNSNINGIVRLNDTDGTLDNSFAPGTGASYMGSSNTGIWTTVIQGDGKIIIGGYSDYFSGTLINRIARLNNDGTIDNIFDQGTGTNSPVLTSSIQADGKIIIGGGFSTYNGTSRNGIARILDSETAGINENEYFASLSVYPNPTKDKFYIDLQLEANYTLTNVFGQEIKKGTLFSGTNELDAQALASGLYVLNLETIEGTASKKIIKQ